MNKEPIEIATDDGKILVANFLASYELDLKKGVVTFDIAPKLVPHLTQLKKNFTSYQLKYIPALSSSYAIRMYELLYQYLKIGKRAFSVDDFRKKVGAPKTYRYNDLKKRVIIPAQEQLKQHTNIAFIFNEQKKGRSIVKLEFIIFSNTPVKDDKQTELEFLTDILEEEQQQQPAFSEKIIHAMQKMGISEANIAKYLAQDFAIIHNSQKREKAKQRCPNLQNYYIEKLELTHANQDTTNKAGFFIKALKEDWVNSKTLKQHQAKTIAQKRRDAEKKINQLERQIEKWHKAKKVAQIPVIAELFTDDAIFQVVYQEVIGGFGNFTRSRIASVLHLPIREQYQQNATISLYMDMECIKRYPEKFSKALAIGEQIKQAKQEIKQLKKQFKL